MKKSTLAMLTEQKRHLAVRIRGLESETPYYRGKINAAKNLVGLAETALKKHLREVAALQKVLGDLASDIEEASQ